jgi:uncharacterized RDD family membrane protein YckC
MNEPATGASHSDQASGLKEDLMREDEQAMQPQPRVEPQYQTFWPRIVAVGIDVLILMGVLNIGALLDAYFGISYGTLVSEYAGADLFIAYRVLMHAFWGQTLGKRACRVRVVDLSGRPLSMRQVLLREIVPLMLSLASTMRLLLSPDAYQVLGILFAVYSAWLLLQVAVMLLDRRQRAIHDYIAGTIVVRLDTQAVDDAVEWQGHTWPNWLNPVGLALGALAGFGVCAGFQYGYHADSIHELEALYPWVDYSSKWQTAKTLTIISGLYGAIVAFLALSGGARLLRRGAERPPAFVGIIILLVLFGCAMVGFSMFMYIES